MKFHLFLATVILSLCFSSLYGQDVDRSNHQLLWEISGNGFEKPSYLFGSMHVKDERVFEFPDSMLICLESCEGFSGELDMDSLTYFVVKEMFSGDTSNVLKKTLSPEAYEGLDRRLQRKAGKSIEDLDNKQPWFIEMMLDEDEDGGAETDFEAFLDLYLYDYAKKLGKRTFGLEELEDQLSLSLLKYQTYEEYFTDPSNIDSEAEQGDLLEELTQVYLSGDIHTIDSIFIASMPDGIYKQKLLTDRNIVMADNIERFGKEFPVFNVVGAAHLPGDDGVIALLRQRGFSLRPVTAEFTGKNPLKDLSGVELPWYSLDRRKERWCALEFPAPPVRIKKIEGLDLDDFDFYMSMDMFSQEAYMYMCMEFPNVSDAGRQMAMEEGIKETFRGSLEGEGDLSVFDILKGEQKEGEIPIYDIEYKGMKGRAYKALTVNGLLDMRGFVQGDRVYFLYGYSQTDTLKHADRFFNSFEYFPKREELYEERVVLDSAGIAFQAPVPMKLKVIQGDNGIVISTYQGVDNDEDIFYAVQYYDMPESNYITNENEIIKNLITGMRMRGGESFKRNHEIRKEKYNYKEISFTLSGYVSNIAYFFRGNRIYSVIITAQNKELADQALDRLAGSLEMLDIPFPELEERDCPEAGFSISLPSPDTVLVEENIEFPIIAYYTIAGYDAQAAVPCRAEGMRFSPYFKMENLDTFFVGAQNLAMGEYATVLSSRRLVYQGFPAMDVVYESDSTNVLTHLRLVLAGDWVYYLSAYLPRELSDSEYINNILNSLEINTSMERGSVVVSKADKIVADLNTTDKDTYDELQGALEDYEFVKEDLPAIHKALRLEIPLDTSDYYYTLKERLIYALGDMGDETSIPVLKELFPTFNVQEQMAAIDAVGDLEGDDLDVFWKMAAAANVEDEGFNSYCVVEHLSGKTARVAKHFPRIMELAENEHYATNLYAVLLGMESDSLVDKEAVLSPYLPELQSRLERGFESWLARGKEEGGPSYSLENLIWLLSDHSESPSFFAFLEKNMAGAEGDILVNMAVALLKNNIALDKEEWEFLEGKGVLEDVLWWLSDRDFEYSHHTTIPKKYRNQAVAARAGMKGYFIVEEDRVVADIQFVKRKKIKRGDDRFHLYIYELEVDDTEPTVLGVFVKPADKSNYSVKASYYNYRYLENTREDLDGKVEELMEYFYEE